MAHPGKRRPRGGRDRAGAQGAAALALFLLALLARASGAQAFGDCSQPAWRAAVDPRLEAIDYDCVEALRLSVATADGERWLRVVHDRDAGWVLTDGILAEVERGLRAAATSLPRLGSFHLADVTLLLADDLPPGIGVEGLAPGAGEIAAQTTPGRSDECVIVLYLLGAGARSEYTAITVAHEIFHCLQNATLDPAQMATSAGGTGSGGDWWIEGSAEWFTALSLADPGPLPNRAALFDSVSPDQPLNTMAYGAVIYFLWLGGTQGPTAVLPFLASMAGDASAAAQWSAMATAQAGEQWLRFAEDYRDAAVYHPHGTALGMAPQPGTTYPIERSQRLRLVATPFQLLRGTLDLACGRWRVTSESPQLQIGQRNADGGGWETLPAEITVPEGERGHRDFVAVNTTAGRRPLVLHLERLATCQPCAGSREIDSCLVGAWRQSGGGAVEWLRAVLPPDVSIPHVAQSEAIFALQADGSFITLPLTQEITILVQTPDGIARAEGQGMAQGAGRWSAVGGQLNICQDSGGLLGSMTMTTPKGFTGSGSLDTPGAGTLAQSYSCVGDSLTTSLDFGGGLPPMTSDYQRLTE